VSSFNPNKESTVNTPERFKLTDKERSLGKRRPTKTLFVAVINFRGPRGRRYRPMRTAATMTPQQALDQAQDIRTRPYAHGAFATTTTLYAVDFIGRTLGEVTIHDTIGSWEVPSGIANGHVTYMVDIESGEVTV